MGEEDLERERKTQEYKKENSKRGTMWDEYKEREKNEKYEEKV